MAYDYGQGVLSQVTDQTDQDVINAFLEYAVGQGFGGVKGNTFNMGDLKRLHRFLGPANQDTINFVDSAGTDWGLQTGYLGDIINSVREHKGLDPRTFSGNRGPGTYEAPNTIPGLGTNPNAPSPGTTPAAPDVPPYMPPAEGPEPTTPAATTPVPFKTDQPAGGPIDPNLPAPPPAASDPTSLAAPHTFGLSRGLRSILDGLGEGSRAQMQDLLNRLMSLEVFRDQFRHYQDGEWIGKGHISGPFLDTIYRSLLSDGDWRAAREQYGGTVGDADMAFLQSVLGARGVGEFGGGGGEAAGGAGTGGDPVNGSGTAASSPSPGSGFSGTGGGGFAGGGGGFGGGGFASGGQSTAPNPLDVFGDLGRYLEDVRDENVWSALSTAGATGNRYGSHALRTAAEVGGDTALEMQAQLSNLLYNTFLQNQGFALQAALGAPGLALAGNTLDLSRLGALQDFSLFEQGRGDDISRILFETFNNNQYGLLPLLLQGAFGGSQTPSLFGFPTAGSSSADNWLALLALIPEFAELFQ